MGVVFLEVLSGFAQRVRLEPIHFVSHDVAVTLDPEPGAQGPLGVRGVDGDPG